MTLFQKTVISKYESFQQEEVITKKLYKDYSVFKNELFQNIRLLNPEYDSLLLFRKTHQLLDRLLFIFFWRRSKSVATPFHKTNFRTME